MIDFEVSKQLESDFERYMFKFYTKYQRFSIEDFGKFASSILNYNVQNHLIDQKIKKEYAYFLTTLYNKGIGKRITEEHLQVIAESISSDSSVDFTVIQELFG
ncbi:MAG TPA: hypothetical protein VK023_06190 [Sphingobacterium bovisgrunnientis]|jgi:hypothetical protein|uniref:hypothetical protein n=1 Tax=Sphingobacterium bovisgrunnientis TaxID=1874697 RepID=UPI00135807C5|nr:hypothetical protein [Sphingobacterium bovisgrunnientis]HLS37845.1 hypothetical protein [Sphingobacterium bovisgrunnientis]